MGVAKQSLSNNFDSLRLIFALLVIFSHSFPLGLGSYVTEPLWMLTGGQIEVGKVSVWGFFCDQRVSHHAKLDSLAVGNEIHEAPDW